MSEGKELVEAVVEAAAEVEGRKRLTCAEAFRLAERFGVAVIEIGRVCNEQNIRISDCQLGCFK